MLAFANLFRKINILACSGSVAAGQARGSTAEAARVCSGEPVGGREHSEHRRRELRFDLVNLAHLLSIGILAIAHCSGCAQACAEKTGAEERHVRENLGATWPK